MALTGRLRTSAPRERWRAIWTALVLVALAGAMRSLHDSRSIELTSWVASNPTLAQKSTVTSINNAVFWRSKRCRNKNHVLHALHQS